MASAYDEPRSADVVLAELAPVDKDISVQHVPSVDSSVGMDLLLLVCFLVTILLVGFVLRLFLQMWRSRIECQWSEDEAAVRQLI
uniref:Uncharacterized protein n=1 Tax=Anopheles minimus TaxID=112268 RepID=A0A182WKS0_9DIPT